MGRGPGAVTLVALPLRAPGAETRAAPCPGEGGARMPVWRLRMAGVTWPCAVEGLGRSRSGSPGSQPPAGAGLQVHLGAAPVSARRRRPGVRALPEARCRRAGLAPHCGSGCGPGWARRGRVDDASSHYHPLSFSPPNARCHLFTACHVFTVPCQAGWLGFGGQDGAVTKEGGGHRR